MRKLSWFLAGFLLFFVVACGVLASTASTLPETAPFRFVPGGIAWTFRDVVDHGQTICEGEHILTITRGREMTGICEHAVPIRVVP